MKDITPIIFLTLNLKLMNVRMQQFHFIKKSIIQGPLEIVPDMTYISMYVEISETFDPINHF